MQDNKLNNEKKKIELLKKYKELLDANIITQEEFNQIKGRIIQNKAAANYVKKEDVVAASSAPIINEVPKAEAKPAAEVNTSAQTDTKVETASNYEIKDNNEKPKKKKKNSFNYYLMLYCYSINWCRCYSSNYCYK